MNKIFLGIAFLFLIVSACVQNEPDPFYEKLDFKHDALRYMSFEPNIERSKMSHEIIILPIDKDGQNFEITIENFIGKLVYDKHYKKEYPSYAYFLNALSKKEIYIRSSYIDSIRYTAIIDTNFYGYINPDHRIIQEYKTKGFQFILKKYFTKITMNGDRVIYELNLTKSPININVLHKIFYENKFLGGTDCVTGKTRFYKL